LYYDRSNGMKTTNTIEHLPFVTALSHQLLL